MPRVDVPVTNITRAGVAPATEVNADVANGHSFANNGKVILLVRNSDAGGSHNVTIVTPGTVDEAAIADKTINVPLSASRYIGPFPTGTYNADGEVVEVNVDHATLRLSAYRLT